MSLVCPLQAQDEDNVGPCRALLLDGMGDYIDLGNRYDDIELPVTISAWIYLSSSVTDWAPVFVSQDNANLYNGFWLIVQPGLVSIGYGEGKGENLPLYRRSKTAGVPNIRMGSCNRGNPRQIGYGHLCEQC